jgi:6-phosphogluconolactonase
MIVYVSNADSREIRVLDMDDATGAIHQRGSVATPGIAGPMAVAPDRRSLHVALRNEPWSVASFAILPDGGLRQLSVVPITENTCYISLDRTGRYLFQASFQGSRISVNAVGPDGFVQVPPVQVIATPPNAHCILADPANQHVLATCLGGGTLLQFDFDPARGVLNPNEVPAVLSEVGAGPRHFRFHPRGRNVYLLHERKAWIYAFAYDPASGQLTETHRVKLMPDEDLPEKIWCADIQISPDGRHLYATERSTSTINIFEIEPDGGLRRLGSVVTEKEPRGIAIHPHGTWLLAVGQASHGMSVYAVDQMTGALTKTDEVPMGQNPHWIEIVDIR